MAATPSSPPTPFALSSPGSWSQPFLISPSDFHFAVLFPWKLTKASSIKISKYLLVRTFVSDAGYLFAPSLAQFQRPQSSSMEFSARLRLATALCCCSQASRRFRKVVRDTFRATWWPKGSLTSSWFRSPAKEWFMVSIIPLPQRQDGGTPHSLKDTMLGAEDGTNNQRKGKSSLLKSHDQDHL